MPRRKIKLGRDPFGQPRQVDQHALEVLRRIIASENPFTEDAVLLAMWNILRQQRSQLFSEVRASKNVGGGQYRYFTFLPDYGFA